MDIDKLTTSTQDTMAAVDITCLLTQSNLIHTSVHIFLQFTQFQLKEALTFDAGIYFFFNVSTPVYKM
jgi:hypothetical protein